MKSDLPPATDLEKASEALNHILGLGSDVTPEQLIQTFGTEENFEKLSRPGISVPEIRQSIIENSQETDPELSSQEIISNGLTAFWNWAKTGFGVTGPEQYEARLAVCGGCNHYKDAPPTKLYRIGGKLVKTPKICGLCGCLMEKKARLASENCPAPHDEIKGVSKWNEPYTPMHKKKPIGFRRLR